MKAHIGMVGLGVMGRNLTLNIERNGFSVAVFDREPQVVSEFIAEAGHKQITGAQSPQDLVESLARPRKIVLLVKAGDPVDWTINLVKPYLERGDIIIDCGNSHFKDTERRQRDLESAGLFLIGSGTSGGEAGALWGPSLMPGGDPAAYEQIRPIWEAIAAKVADGPCVTYIGPGGSGHYVKMVHNGIEYGDMQLIAESYDLLRNVLHLQADQIAEVFEEWNKGELESYLIEITGKILRYKDPETGKPLIDLVQDQAGQKGTGKWTGQVALDLGESIPTIDAAIATRNISAQRETRVKTSRLIEGPQREPLTEERAEFIKAIHDSLYGSKICCYAQGMKLIHAGSEMWNWNINLSEVARIWQGGCIIRARLLRKIKEAYHREPGLAGLLLDAGFASFIAQTQQGWRSAVVAGVKGGLPVAAMSASIGYLDLQRTAELPLNLTQAQRDFFGAHTYQRTDKPELGFIHTKWE